MCNAFEENWLDGLEEGMKKGREEIIKTMCLLVKDGFIKADEAAKRINMTEAAFNEKLEDMVCR